MKHRDDPGIDEAPTCRACPAMIDAPAPSL
jgi:hypothetical protein